MKLAAMMLAIAALAEAKGTNDKLIVCVRPADGSNVLNHAEILASRILAPVGAAIEWHPSRTCPVVTGVIRIQFQNRTSDDRYPGALAYAMPLQGTDIVVMFDRVKRVGQGDFLPRLLAYVIVHEITHILQGTARHSANGIMEARWTEKDYSDMRGHGLGFTQLDVDLLNRGLAARTEHAAVARPSLPDRNQ
jgi:hypothetical protein